MKIIDKLLSQVPQPMDSFSSNKPWDDETDKLFSQVPQPMDCFSSNKPWDHKLDQLIQDPKPATNTQPGSHSGSSTKANAGQTTAVDNRFQSVTATQVKKATCTCTSWCLNIWKAWRDYRKTVSESDIPSHLMILATNKPKFCRWLCHFMLEVRRQDGAEYPPNSLHQLYCGILRYAREREPELDIFHDPALCHLIQ